VFAAVHTRVQSLLDKEGYGQSLETALWELDQLFAADSGSVHEFLALKDEEALTKFLKFIGCTAFELSKKKRVEQDLKNLAAVLACVRTIVNTEVRLCSSLLSPLCLC
jgi:hypothetical protein